MSHRDYKQTKKQYLHALKIHFFYCFCFCFGLLFLAGLKELVSLIPTFEAFSCGTEFLNGTCVVSSTSEPVWPSGKAVGW